MAALDTIERFVQGLKPNTVEIRPEPEYTVIRGSARDSNRIPIIIRGKIAINSDKKCAIKGARITLRGQRRTMRFRPRERGHTNSMPPIDCTHQFFFEEKALTRDNGDPIRHLDIGPNIFEFSWTLPADSPETIAGVDPNHIRYDMKVVFERSVLHGHNLSGAKHIRLIRSLPEGSTALQDPVSTESVWDNKGVRYCVTSKCQAAALGDVIPVHFQITKYKADKVSVRDCELKLEERQRIKTRASPDHPSAYHEKAATILRVTVPIPDSYQDEDPVTGDPRWNFVYRLVLPASLNGCRQSVPEDEWIQIIHKLHCYINLENADGHISRVQPAHDIHLFISEQRPIPERANLNLPHPHNVEGGGQSVAAAAASSSQDDTLLSYLSEAPPTYNNSRLDSVFEGVWEGNLESGAVTPAPTAPLSGMATPGAYNFSRRGSADVAALQHYQPSAGHYEALSSRLAGLQITPVSPGEGSSRTSPIASRTNSYVGLSALAHGQHSNLVGGYNMEEMSRLESYDAAVQRRASPTEAPPPTYDAATSRRSSEIEGSPQQGRRTGGGTG